MADKPAPKKRQVKNPETFRERALKSTEGGDKPKRGTRLKQASDRVANPVVGPVRRTVSTVYNLPLLKPLRVILSLLAKVLFISYFRKSWQELKQVTWPGRTESRRLTVAVLIFAIVFGTTIAIVDYGLDKAFRQLLLK